MIKILVVEDKTSIYESYQDSLPELEIIWADTIAQAMQLFTDHSDFAAIVLDACVPGSIPNTMGLAHHFRKTFNGPIIAASSDDKYNDRLMQSGCDYKSPKHFVPTKLREILGLSTQPPHH